MRDLEERIIRANDIEIERILKAVRKRYAVQYPDWEVVIISIEKSADRNEQLDRMITMLKNMKT